MGFQGEMLLAPLSMYPCFMSHLSIVKQFYSFLQWTSEKESVGVGLSLN